jgi:hypothetical protein
MYRTFRAVRFLFVGPMILLVCLATNVLSYHGHWWVKWVALGIGIAWIISLMRLIRLLVMLGGIAALVAYLRRR